MSVSLDRLATFRAVVEAGSFAAAARRLHQARAAVSFQIRQLEIELGVLLLHRTTRRLALTAAGERFHTRCLRILAEAEEAIAEARSEQAELSGSLRITSTVEYGMAVVAPALNRFAMAHPQLEVHFEASSANVDLLRDRFDVAIRLGREEQFQDSPYVGTLLGRYQLRPVASPAIAAMTETRRPEMLGALPHVINATVEEVGRWTMIGPDGGKHVYTMPRPSRIVANSASIVKALSLAGAGVALLPDWFVAHELRGGTLIDMLPGYRFAEHSIYALRLPMASVPRKIGSWIAHLRDAV